MPPAGLAALAEATGEAPGVKLPSWKDYSAIYPELEVILKGLQDVSKLVNCNTKAGREKGLK